MPLIASALLAYLAGLLAGFSENLVLMAGALLVGAALSLRLRRAPALLMVTMAAVGIGAAGFAQRGRSRCLEAALRAPSLALIVDDSVARGTFVRGRLLDCPVLVGVSVSDGAATAGSTVIATGDAARSARGIALSNAHVRATRAPAPLRAWRNAAARAIDRTFVEDAPLVKALLVADWSGLSPAVKDRWAAAGLSHMLSISGLHIAIIAAAIELLLELAGVARQRAAVVTIGVSVFYVALIGAPLPAVRTVLMSTIVLVSRIIQRPVARWGVLAVGAAHPIIDPFVVLDAGYQLSVVGVAALIAAGALAKRLHVRALRAPFGALATALLASTMATIASAPIIAWIFGRVSIIGLLTNLVASPLIALAQPMIFLGMVMAPAAPAARFIADAAHPLLAALDRVAAMGAAVPGATITVIPTIVTGAIACVLSGATIVAAASDDWEAPAGIAALCAAVLVWMPSGALSRGEVELHMIDVGQGDAVALRTPHGHWILVDAGGAWSTGDAGRSTVLPYLARRGGPLDLFILSHPHTDHVGGASSILRGLPPATYLDAGFPGAAGAYRASLQTAREVGVRWARAHPGDQFHVDGITLDVLAPDSAWTAGLDDPNLASVVVLARYGDVRMLFMGDAEREEEEWLLARHRDRLRADVLKVGHHGSRTSSTEPLLDAVQPRLALVSVGAGNSYHLPTPEIMDRLAARGALVLRTDRVGTIVARTDGRRVRIAAGGDEWDLSNAAFTP